MNTNKKNYTDPICGMSVSADSHLQLEYEGQKYFFCSQGCQDKFAKNPTQYIKNNLEPTTQSQNSFLKTYYPIILIFAYLIGASFLIELSLGSMNLMRTMTHFMGFFFIVFSFFKLLDLKGFASGFSSYDWITKKVPIYGFVYPFIELGLGVSYFLIGSNFALNLIVAILMFVSALGIIQSIVNKNTISCACLGTIFKLPLSTVSLLEVLSMLVMALVGIFST